LKFSKCILTNNQANEAALRGTRLTLLTVLETLLRLLHPVIPYITEEIWQRIKPLLGMSGDTIMHQPFPQSSERDLPAEEATRWLMEVIQGVRRIRSELDLPPGKPLEVWMQSGDDSDRSNLELFQEIFAQMARVKSMEWVDDATDTAQCAVALVGDLKVLVPLKGLVDVEAESARLRKQLEAEKALLNKSQAKLDNRQFVDNAPPAVVEQERERQASHLAKVDKLSSQLKQIESLRN